jgi:tetratricopeptide (TPR) repeat protein
MKDYDRAAKAFARVAKLDNKDIDAREYLLDICRRQEKPREALAVLGELMELRPDYWPYYAKVFEIYNELGEYEEMTKILARGVGKMPEQPELRYFLGLSYEKRNLLVEAIHQFEALLKLEPENTTYLMHLAGLYEQIGKIKDALKTYEKVLQLDPENPDAQESYLRLKMQEIGEQ